MITESKKKSSIPMPKMHSKINSLSKENVKVNSKSPEKNDTGLTATDNNINKKRKLSKIISTPSKADISSTNIRPAKFPRKSISQTSRPYKPKSTNGNTGTNKTNESSTTTTTKTSQTTPISSPKASLASKNLPHSSVVKTPISKTIKSEAKVKPLSTHKTPSTIKKPVASKTIIKNKTSPTNANSADNSIKKANKEPKSKYGITLTKRPRRSGWDTKGLLEDAKKDITELTHHIDKTCKLLEQKDEELNEKAEQINQLQLDKEKSVSEIEAVKAEKEKEKQECDELLKTKENEVNELKEKNNKLEDTYGQFVKEHDKLKEEHNNLINEHSKVKKEYEELTKKHNAISEELNKANEIVKDLNKKIENKDQRIGDFEKQVDNFKLETKVDKKYIEELQNIKNQNEKRIKELELERERHLKRIASLEDDYLEAKKSIQALEEQRRFLHNEIQELKGNIRVFCRVRPVLESEKEKLNGDDSTPHIVYPKDNNNGITLVQQTESAMGSASSKSYPFSFDRVFDGRSRQEEVFTEIAQLVQSALDGYNVCIFAYGQTGSGKTYTMEGGEDIETMGMIPRAVKQIFIASEDFKKKGWIYDIDCQFLEIYNETIRDLLENDETQKHEIKHLSHGRTIVTDAKIVKVTTSDEVHKLLQIASKNRSTGATLCNERSSRSHRFIFIYILLLFIDLYAY